MDSNASLRTCTGCGETAPQTDSDYTLIGAAHGWRLRRYDHHGDAVAEWWCPECWAGLKKASGDLVAMTASPPSKNFEPR